jgi:hypothetical protein
VSPSLAKDAPELILSSIYGDDGLGPGVTVAVRSLPDLDGDDLNRVIGREHGVDGHERHQDTRRDEDADLRLLGHCRGASARTSMAVGRSWRRKSVADGVPPVARSAGSSSSS